MKRFFFAALTMVMVGVPFVVGATSRIPATTVSGFNVTTTKNATVGLSNITVFSLVTTFMNWLLGIVGVLAVVAFVISGILYLTATGNEDRIEMAKTIMLYAIIGLVVALLGLIIVNAIAGLTGAAGGTTY